MAATVLIVDDEPHIRLLLEQTLDELSLAPGSDVTWSEGSLVHYRPRRRLKGKVSRR